MTAPLPIVLLTDFGLSDWYAGAMKCEIARRAPGAPVIDLCHGIAPQDVAAGAFVLKAAMGSLPQPAVVCAVVDPGVGAARRAICGKIGHWYFAGPDNGLATPLLERADHFELYEIVAREFRTERPGTTFHGRDLFAPAAAMLAIGANPREAGPPVSDPVKIDLNPKETDGSLRGRVMLIDRFGNLVTNIWREKHEERLAGKIAITAGHLSIDRISGTFSDVPPGAPLAYWGSAGTLEIGINMGSAADTSGTCAGDFIEVTP